MLNKKKILLKDIAEKAGVSTALVSYVMSGKEKISRVSPEMSDKIRKIAKELQYKPNLLAKSLRSGKSQTIGLIIADIANPFFANIARVVEDEAKKSGYTLLIGSSDENPKKFSDLINVFLNRQVDGLIMVVTEKSLIQIKSLQKKNYPFVLLDRYYPELATDYVSIDSFKASYAAATHLLTNGYTKIGFIGYESSLYHMQQRKEGVLAALKTAGITPVKHWVKALRFDKVEDEIMPAIDSLLKSKDPVNAIIFATYRLAINGLKHLRHLKIKIPHQLAIVSFGQSESFELYECPITYLEQPLGELGKKAVQLLLEQLGHSNKVPNQVLMDTRLVIGESSGALERATLEKILI